MTQSSAEQHQNVKLFLSRTLSNAIDAPYVYGLARATSVGSLTPTTSPSFGLGLGRDRVLVAHSIRQFRWSAVTR